MNTFPASRNLEATFSPHDTPESIPFETQQQATILEAVPGFYDNMNENTHSTIYNGNDSFFDNITSKMSVFIPLLNIFNRNTFLGSMALLAIFVAFALCFLKTIIFLNTAFDSRQRLIIRSEKQRESLLTLHKFIHAASLLSIIMIISNPLSWIHEAWTKQVSFFQILFVDAFTLHTFFIGIFSVVCSVLILLIYRKYKEIKELVTSIFRRNNYAQVLFFSEVYTHNKNIIVLIGLAALIMLIGYIFTISNIAHLFICLLIMSATSLLHTIIKKYVCLP